MDENKIDNAEMNPERTHEVSSSMDMETGVEAQEPAPPTLIELCRDTFQKSAKYLKGELEGTIDDYKLLEQMNKITITRYEEMKKITMSVGKALHDLNDKYKTVQPHLDQIDQIDASVSSLEQAAYALDNYSKNLETKFRTLEKR